jgi:DNA mismatch repair protein MutS
LTAGAADHSYGIEVARMAGLPAGVLQRAAEVLSHLEAHDVAGELGVRAEGARLDVVAGLPAAGSSPAAAYDPAVLDVVERLRGLDVDRMSPIEALLALAELRHRLDANS